MPMSITRAQLVQVALEAFTLGVILTVLFFVSTACAGEPLRVTFKGSSVTLVIVSSRTYDGDCKTVESYENFDGIPRQDLPQTIGLMLNESMRTYVVSGTESGIPEEKRILCSEGEVGREWLDSDDGDSDSAGEGGAESDGPEGEPTAEYPLRKVLLGK